MGKYDEIPEDRINELCSLIGDSHRTVQTACRMAGVPYSTLRRFLSLGARDIAVGDTDTSRAILHRRINEAVGKSVAHHEDQINAATDWRAHAWAAEKKDPETFSVAHQVNVKVERELENFMNILAVRLRPDEFDRILRILAEERNGDEPGALGGPVVHQIGPATTSAGEGQTDEPSNGGEATGSGTVLP